MKKFKNLHDGETCYILGNGPSLNDVDFEQLKDKVTFGSNGIFKNDWDFMPTYLVAVNPLVLDQMGDGIVLANTIKFLSKPFDLPTGVEPTDIGETHILDTSVNTPFFQSDITKPLWEGHTVTYVCLQIAFYMGFKEVILLGLDHYFGEEVNPNKEVIAAGKDEWHFRDDYFSDGMKWNLPDLAMSEIAYSLAKWCYADAGRKIINCSSKTACKVFPVQPLKFKEKTVVSAIVSAYKSGDFIVGLLEDLYRQKMWARGWLEIVAVCQEGSPEDIFLSDHLSEKLKVIRTPNIPTIYDAWNMAIKESSGIYITNANTDDRHESNAFELMAIILDSNPHLDVVYHDSYISWEPNQTFEEFEEKEEKLVMGREIGEPGLFRWPDYARHQLADGCFMGPQPMWRANLHQRFGMFNPEMQSAGDYEFWLRISEKDNFFHIPMVLGLYCAREDGVELRDLELSSEESWDALDSNQANPGAEIRAITPDTTRIKLGDSYMHANTAALKKLVSGL